MTGVPERLCRTLNFTGFPSIGIVSSRSSWIAERVANTASYDLTCVSMVFPSGTSRSLAPRVLFNIASLRLERDNLQRTR
ncbi:hypothetical protein PUNSTDRAFT_55531 [Punctularia strigosozonata HHB-11173 SS5]|uniref:Uncharacterized protein n=1 Tax=Punctularia strigosozonata (strain HHB-11173) TaxID=741275 RepID=R7S2S6_PUNST|nr:uncharacterized protein PUNSTDRAFT_55531 [Punctularia strigosozonata HHB-11173 SS5]EIN04518.1 hypothetical protein PUNSTDRAFT_55531 [Punctularia strigosozonata HHB-11173 SS5]